MPGLSFLSNSEEEGEWPPSHFCFWFGFGFRFSIVSFFSILCFLLFSILFSILFSVLVSVVFVLMIVLVLVFEEENRGGASLSGEIEDVV